MNSARGSCRLRSWAAPFRARRGCLRHPGAGLSDPASRKLRSAGKTSRRRHHLRRCRVLADPRL